MFGNLKFAVRHANKQARRLAKLEAENKKQEAKRLERELRHVRADIDEQAALLDEADDTRIDSPLH